MTQSTNYDTDLTDAEWEIVEPLVPAPKLGGRPPRYTRRALLNAIFYVKRTGCSWRLLPHDYPYWKTVYSYFRVWRDDGTFERINDALRARMREAVGRNAVPTAGIVDSRSVKTSQKGGVRGYDGGKKVNGRKHHLIVDTQGLLLGVKVLPANISDREGSKQLLQELQAKQPQWKLHLFVDGGYKGPWDAWVKTHLGYSVEVVQRPDANTRGYWLPEGQSLTPEQIKTFKGHREFVVIKKRWIVERRFAWLSFDRRLNREYDLLPQTTEAFIFLAFIRLMLRRLASNAVQQAVSA